MPKNVNFRTFASFYQENCIKHCLKRSIVSIKKYVTHQFSNLLHKCLCSKHKMIFSSFCKKYQHCVQLKKYAITPASDLLAKLKHYVKIFKTVCFALLNLNMRYGYQI